MMLVKHADAQGIAVPEIMFWRQFLTIPALLLLLGITGQFQRLKTQRIKSHAIRAILGTLGMASLFGATILLSLPQASVLTFTSPFFAVLLPALFFGQKAGPWRWTAVAIGFCGVLILAQPGSQEIHPIGALAGLSAALIVVVVSYQVKDLARTDDPLACVFYLSLFAALFLSLLLPFYAQSHTTYEWLILISIGLTGLISQFLLTISLKYGAVSTVLIMDYTLLLWSTFYSWLVFENLPQTSTWLGGPLIIAAGIIITWREHRLHRAASSLSANKLD